MHRKIKLLTLLIILISNIGCQNQFTAKDAKILTLKQSMMVVLDNIHSQAEMGHCSFTFLTENTYNGNTYNLSFDEYLKSLGYKIYIVGDYRTVSWCD